MSARAAALLVCLMLPAACSMPNLDAPGVFSFAAVEEPATAGYNPPLHPNETLALREAINRWADHYDLPRALVHRLAIRESTHNPAARNGPYWGLFQILPQTARTMGFRGKDSDLLDPEVNLQYALKYLKGAYVVAGGNQDAAIRWYASGYYYEAKRQGKLVETGLRKG